MSFNPLNIIHAILTFYTVVLLICHKDMRIVQEICIKTKIIICFDLIADTSVFMV